MIEIRKAVLGDQDQVWKIIEEVISSGETYVFRPGTSRETMLGYWFAPDKHTYVATKAGHVVGTFFLKENQPDLGSHVANASYMVALKASSQGIGRAMGEYSLKEARRLGFNAMQFNMVVKTNKTAIQLWRSLGFDIVGEIPDAFNHQGLGLTSVYVMHRKL